MNTLIAVVCRFLLMAAVGIAACGAAIIGAAWPASGWILLVIAGVCAVRRHKSGWEFGTAAPQISRTSAPPACWERTASSSDERPTPAGRHAGTP